MKTGVALAFVLAIIEHTLVAQTLILTVNTEAVGNSVPESFVGFSFNPSYTSQFFGTNYNGNNDRVVSVKMYNNLYPFQKSGLRIIGANGSCWKRAGSTYANAPTAWNNTTMAFPFIPLTTPAFSTTVDQKDLDDVGGFLDDLLFTPTVLFGMNASTLDDGRAADFASNLNKTLKTMRRPDLDLQFELGNEPDIFVANGRRVSGYGYAEFQQEFNVIAQAVKEFGGVAGPALAKCAFTTSFAVNLANFISATNSVIGVGKLKTITYHAYPLGLASDGTAASFMPKYFTADTANSKYSEKYTELEVTQDFSPSIAVAKRNGIAFRMGETSSIGGGGVDGASNTFGAALWAIDYMYELAKAGADGINFAIEGSSTAFYSPWTFQAAQLDRGDIVLVRPIYYGILFFARTVQNRARLIDNMWTSTGSPHVRVWSTKDAFGVVRVMIINKGTTLTDSAVTRVTVKMNAPVDSAVLYELRPAVGGISATNGITINGQWVSQLGVGTAGELTGATCAPTAKRKFENNETCFTFNVAAASAMILETTSAVVANDPTSVSPQGEASVGGAPAVFALFQNYPNPFNPSTTISFTVLSTGHATLKIFNTLGQESANIFDGDAHAGLVYRMLFNGSGLSSGVYIARLQCNGNVQFRKMVLNK